MIFKAIKAISYSFSKKLKIKYLCVVIFNILSGFLEALSVAFVIPFIMLLFNKNELIENELFVYVYDHLSFSSYDAFIIFFSILFLVIIFISNIFSIINVWLITYITYQLDYNLILKLFKNFIFLGYENKINVNSSDLISKLTIQIKRFIEGVVNSSMIVFQKLILILFIVIFLAYVNLKVVILTLLVLIILYFFFYKIISSNVHKKGTEMTLVLNERQRLISESIFGIKEIMLYNLQKKLSDKLTNLSKKLTLNMSFVRTAAVAPRYFLEIIIFLITIPLSLYLFIYANKNLGDIFPIFAAFIFALYKISPAAQAIFSAFVNIKADITAFDLLKKDIKINEEIFIENSKNKIDFINFENYIFFKDISFSYKQNPTKTTLKNIDIKIIKNEVTGIFGHSGSGKTSFLNLLLGFLKPTTGSIIIDNKSHSIYNNHQWMKKIGYVSQFTFLFDDTLLNNVTMFEKNPNKDKVIDSLYRSGLKNYFQKNDQNLDLIIGERGSKISGGEAQRLGLARALYRNPEILILDEFTSSLDEKTENEIIENLSKLKKNITIILSSHKYSVLKECDQLFEVKNKTIKKNFYE